MSWSIAAITNSVAISKACAKELYAVIGEDVWSSEEDVRYLGKLAFYEDHREHMDYLATHKEAIEILKKYKVRGDICFGSLEGDNANTFWGYRFDGAGGMQRLSGTIVWVPQKPKK